MKAANPDENPPIYKYMGNYQYVTDMLILSKFYFSSVDTFNDPFDASIEYQPVNQSDIDLMVERATRNFGYSEDESEQMRARLEHDTQEGSKKIYKKLFKMLEGSVRELGISCFSRNRSNLLMWSHYADKHEGVCLEFDMKLLLGGLTENTATVFDVYYNSEYPQIRIADIIELDSIEYFKKKSLTKSLDWEYEKEIRIIGTKPGLFKFDSKSITKIIMGLESNAADLDRIQILVEKFAPHIQIMKASKSKYQFKVDITPL